MMVYMPRYKVLLFVNIIQSVLYPFTCHNKICFSTEIMSLLDTYTHTHLIL